MDFIVKYRNVSIFYHFDSYLRFRFYYILGGNLGSLLYGDVSVMRLHTVVTSNVRWCAHLLVNILKHKS